jgi:hypothetical protein
LHSKLERHSLDLKMKLAALAVVLEAGPLVIEVLGGVVSRAKAEDVPRAAINRIATLQVKHAENEQIAR